MPTSRTASGVTAYVQEELAKARTSTERLKRSIAHALDLVRASERRDHLFAVAGDIIYDIPRALQELETSLDTCAMAVNKIDYEQLRQTIRPDKVDELEAVLEDVRMNIPRRTGRLPEAPDA